MQCLRWVAVPGTSTGTGRMQIEDGRISLEAQIHGERMLLEMGRSVVHAGQAAVIQVLITAMSLEPGAYNLKVINNELLKEIPDG